MMQIRDEDSWSQTCPTDADFTGQPIRSAAPRAEVTPGHAGICSRDPRSEFGIRQGEVGAFSICNDVREYCLQIRLVDRAATRRVRSHAIHVRISEAR